MLGLVSVWGLSLVVASGGHSSSRCAGLSLSRPLLLQSTGSRRASSVVVAHGPSCSAACGIFPDQGSNPCPLHWQADSQPLCHQGSLHWFCLNYPSLFLHRFYPSSKKSKLNLAISNSRSYKEHPTSRVNLYFLLVQFPWWSGLSGEAQSVEWFCWGQILRFAKSHDEWKVNRNKCLV